MADMICNSGVSFNPNQLNGELFVETGAVERLYQNKVIPESIYTALKEVTDGIKNNATSAETILGIDYNFALSNTNTDLKKLTNRLAKAWKNHQKPFSMLLYGQSGSGKSYYAKYLAQELGLKFLKKRASDLMDKMVGETEKNIRAAFKEAEEEGAILCIDEADSFLFDRSKATQDHQLAKVNEVLVQMETFKYPFICTTNLIDAIDTACFRRFVFKVKYDYIDKSKVAECATYFFHKKFKKFKDFSHVCAGDFYNIKRKLDILCDKITKTDIEEALQEELDLKPDYKAEANKKVIGFTNSKIVS